jgi:hypothetical protein
MLGQPVAPLRLEAGVDTQLKLEAPAHLHRRSRSGHRGGFL